MAAEPTIILSKLDDKALQESIDKLLRDVHSKMGGVSRAFEAHLSTMQTSLNTFATTIKTVKGDVGDMSKSFEAMFKAMSGTGSSGASGGGGKGNSTTSGGTTTASAPNTIGELKEQIKLQGQIVDQQVRSTVEKERQVNKQRQLANELEKELRSTAQSRLQRGLNMQPQVLDEAQRKLQYLQAVQRRYANTTQLSAQEQRNLANAIARTQREIAKINNVRPKTLKEVLGMDESSVDAITRKMRELKRVQLDTSDATQVKNLASKYQELTNKRREMLGQNQLLENSNLSLARSFGYIRNRLVYAFTIGAVMNFTKELIRVRAEYEMLDRSLGILIGDMEKGTQIFNELNEMALKSPFTLIELGTAAKQLTAYNFAANEVVDTTRRLADISAALGVPMERLTYNLGQIKAQGVLNARDARDFANAGLAIVPMLAKLYTEQKRFGDEIVTTAQVYDMMSKKMVSYGDVLHVLTDITDEGGKFFDFQAKQADTLKVQLANLTLAYNNMLNEIGTNNQGAISGALAMLRSLAQNWKTVKNAILTVITALGTYKTVVTIVNALNSRMFVGSLLVNLRNYVNGIKAATGAMAKFNAVTKMNPLGFLISLLATAGVAFLTFGSNVEEVSEDVEMFGENSAKTLGRIKTIQKILAGLDENTATYKSAMQELNGILNEYGITEISNREEINEKIKQTIALIEEEASARQYANQMAKGEEEYNKKIKEANDEFYKGLQDISFISDAGSYVSDEIKKNLEQNASAISDVVGQVIESNIGKVVGKTGQEAEKGIQEINKEITKAMRNMGFSDAEIGVLLNLTNLVRKQIEAKREAAEAQGEYNQRITDFYTKGQKLSKGVLSFNQKLEAQKKVMTDASSSAKTLYDRIYNIVDLAKKNSKNTITFDLQLTATNPPKWMKNFSDERIRELATNFGAIAAAGGRAKGMTREQTLQRSLEYASEYRLREEAKASQKDDKKTKTRTKQTDEFAKAIKEVGNAMTNTRKKQQELLKEGIDGATILNSISENYGKTIELNNKKLQFFGVKGLKTASDFANMGQREQKGYLLSLLDVAKLRGSAEAIEYLEGKLADLNEEILKTDNKTLIDSLNSELSRLKEEYELAIELDANPELGNMFAEMWGIDLDALPHTAQEYAKVATQSLNKYLKDAKTGIEIDDVLGLTDEDLGFLDDLLASESITQAAYDLIQKVVKGARDARNKEIKDSISGYDKLLEKYAEYEYKQSQIQKKAVEERKDFAMRLGNEEQKSRAMQLVTQIGAATDPTQKQALIEQLKALLREIAGDNEAKLNIVVGIDNKEAEESATLAFEEFKKNPEWLVATGDLAGLTDKALRGLIGDIEEYKKKAKNLNPKQIKEINKALRALHKQLRQGSPFAAIADIFEKAKEGASEYDEEIAKVEKQMQDLNKISENGGELSDEQSKKLQELKDRWEELKKKKEDTEKVDPKALVDGINGMISVISQATNAIGEMFEAFGSGGKNASKTMKDIMSVVEKGGQFAAIGAQIGGGYGAIIGAVAGVATGLISVFTEAANNRITERIKESEQEVKKLENAYKLLNNEAEDAYGTMVMGARQAVKANKELQLAELKRQLALEQSRDSKHRDEDRIIELRGQIIDLEREVNKATEETLNAILGISSHGDFFEDLISSMIDAFKQGEDAMQVFEEKWDEMIDNMIMKTIVQRFLSTWVDSLEQGAEDIINKYTKETSKEKADLAKKISDQQQMDAGDLGEWLYAHNKEYYIKLAEQVSDGQLDYDRLTFADSSWGAERLLWFNEAWRSGLAQKIADAYYADADNQMKVLDQKIADETLSATEDLINYYGGAKEDFKTNYMPSIMEAIKENFTFGQDNEKELSALQRGISSITEETAGALEAITNGISQQCYLQSDLLTQIRDTVQSFDIDVQTSTFAEMLLQLQQSYQVQMSIESILQGVLVPSGRAFAVEIQ